MLSLQRSAVLAVFAACGFWASPAHAQLGNVWHIPDNAEVPGGIPMRDPRFEIGTNTTVTIYTGNQFQGAGNAANQTGGTLYYKPQPAAVWSSTGLTFHAEAGNNKYWKASFNTSAFGPNDVIEYYLVITYSDRANTFVYGIDRQSFTTGDENVARAAPYSFRNRPAWIFHANNRVISGQDVQFWAKVGYISKDGSQRWANNGAVYITTNGAVPGGSLGVATNASTFAVPMALDHTEIDFSPAGNGMWWGGTAMNLPTFTNIRYRIGFWHSNNNEEKFADYNTSGTNNAIFSFSIGTIGEPLLTINGLNANYTTTKLFVDEVAGDSIPLNIVFEPGSANVSNGTVQVFTNLNRRDRAGADANGDGIEDGILPPSGDLVGTGDTHYYRAYTMTPTGTPGQYSVTLNAQKTGAYRLTARYQQTTNPGVWVYYTSGGRRDHAIVVSPKKSRDAVIYELNTLNVEATGASFGQRSTFEDLWDGPGATHTNLWNLNYVKGLGITWLWFQPVHPQGIDGREIDPATGSAYEVGSPYAVKNFFEVQELMSKGNTRAASMNAFTNFVAAADAAGVNIMLDAAFNHTSHDCEAAALGNSFGWGSNPTDQMRNTEARFYSRVNDYCQRAFDANSIAPAPDRGDFGKWPDVKDVYFGRYAALVCQNPQDNGNFNSEEDWFDYTTATGNFDAITRNVWRYFAEYILYWLDKTGHPAGTPANQSFKGIDGLRADFGQGLPPQAWEYIINRARTRKWDFVFMAETLDAGAPSYRSNRHFDILNENIIFALRGATSASAYRSIFEQRRQSFGQGLVLLNTVSHDEENYVDPWQAVIRYAASASIDGAPMIFYGQELGISRTFGFDRYEINFGKTIPHFKKFNSMMPIWNDTDFGNDQLFPVYSAINKARQASPALRSSNRFFLNQKVGGAQEAIFSVAKYHAANASPATSDVVFAFVNLDRDNNQAGTFEVNITQNGSNLFGIKTNRIYNVKNIAAYSAQDSTRSNQFLWGAGFTGADVLSNGVFVLLNRVPTDVGSWTTAPFEAQYLKLFDVTPPPLPGAPGGGTPAGPNFYVVTNAVTFSWVPANDPEGNVAGYRVMVGTSCNDSSVTNVTVGNITSFTVTGSFGQTLFARVAAINTAGIAGPTNCTTTGVELLDPVADRDGDGMSNGNEDTAGTNPFDSASLLRITAVSRLANGNVAIVWDSVAGKKYQVLATTNIASGVFGAISGTNTATSASTAFTNAAPAAVEEYYKVRLIP
jgi:glycosidase